MNEDCSERERLRRRLPPAVLLLVAGALWGTGAVGQPDFSDIDTLLMQDMDRRVKNLEPLIGAKNKDQASAIATFLRDGLKKAEAYFVGKETADAVEYAREGQTRADAVLSALEADDFDAAAAAARGVARSCRTCHDVYRP